jgi:RHH-type transcriptional regulator, proline utilization regulon repressor / proline dehydrogenase / delta 1-pyrroline-5-carboxylate dehydrogenase
MDLTQSKVAAAFEKLAPAPPYQASVLISGKAAGTGSQIVTNPANLSHVVGQTSLASVADIEAAIVAAQASTWPKAFDAKARAACLSKAADLLEARMPEFMALCAAEAGKTFPDAVAEVREAIDFCRYYACQALTAPMNGRAPLGVVACISPWNFPLAIFMGQVVAALVGGNRVIAKPAGQTPLIAHAATKLLFDAGIPVDALHLLIGEGEIGAALVGHQGIDGVCFTGSTTTAKAIAKARANCGRADSVLIAETGGINVMIVDSTALLEQAVGDVMASAFQSAGQRCSACRIVCVQGDVADDFERLLAGAIDVLELGDPSHLTTDVGPIIDAAAAKKITDYIAEAQSKFRVIGQARATDASEQGHFVRPIALGVGALKDVQSEIFGPVLHVVRFAAGEIMGLVDQINASGFGLTLGLHSRIDARIKAISEAAHVGNIYVNRNQIGAIVGVQPFGGEGLSGTGPKAGGPHYLLALTQMTEGSALPAVSAPDAETRARIVAINDLATQLGDDGFVADNLAREIATLPTQQALPGPTGEDNSLRLVPRGVILCLGGDVVRQILVSLATGCSVLVSRADLEPPTLAVIAASPLANQIEITQARDPEITLAQTFDGVLADGAIRQDVGQALAQRDGPIIPLLSAWGDYWRFFHERTLTIDTTAAGGNASLLAMEGA